MPPASAAILPPKKSLIRREVFIGRKLSTLYPFSQHDFTDFRQECFTMSIADRIKEARTHFDLTQTEFGKIAGGVSKAAVSQWENGVTVPERDALRAMQKSRMLSTEWVMTGRGPMLLKESATEHLSDSRRDLIDRIASADVSDGLIDVLRGVIDQAVKPQSPPKRPATAVSGGPPRAVKEKKLSLVEKKK